VEGSDDLRSALVDRGLPAERRQAVVEELLGSKALPASTAIASFVIGIGRAGELAAIVDRFVELVAEARRHEVAYVRSAVAIDDERKQRLADALGAATDRQVEVKVIVDPKVLGGIHARVGDTVIDGSVRHRLEQLKEQI
jgi:F-type H+-transporting ATPase subunit delta